MIHDYAKMGEKREKNVGKSQEMKTAELFCSKLTIQKGCTQVREFSHFRVVEKQCEPWLYSQDKSALVIPLSKLAQSVHQTTFVSVRS